MSLKDALKGTSMRALVFTLALGLCPLAAHSGNTYGEQAAMVINKINAVDFEVLDGPRMGPHEYWCAAASFNEVRLGRSETNQIYIRSPRGPSVTVQGRKGVVFTLDPKGLPNVSRPLTVEVDQAGISFKSSVARRYCRDAFTRSTK